MKKKGSHHRKSIAHYRKETSKLRKNMSKRARYQYLKTLAKTQETTGTEPTVQA
ncbi:MAG: hypothetical protein HQM12_05615 [SAR324 cluster bacterium]|nr:hypothetical protein [SAR324 cluster bacterium]